MVRAVWIQRCRLMPRQTVCAAVFCVAAVALVPGYVWLAPPSRADDIALLVVLGVLAVIVDRHDVPMPSGARFDGAIALMLLAVALAGPLPALEVIVLPWLANALTGRQAAVGIAAVGNLAGYGWQAIVAALLLQSAGVESSSLGSLGPLIVAGFSLYVVGWLAASATYGTLWLGRPLRVSARAFVDMLPAGVVMIVLGGLTVLLTPRLGVLALAVFALIAILPQSFLTYAARTRPVARLDQSTATRRYAHAIAIHLGLSRAERRHLSEVIAATLRRPPTGDAIDYVCALLDDPGSANYHAQLAAEWYDGGGGPLCLRSGEIPLVTRVAVVARTWSALTARGTPQLSHEQALDHLNAVAGIRLDPEVVQAAHAVIDQELVTAEHPAPEPRLHHLRIPAPLRRALTAAAQAEIRLGADR